MAAKNVFAKQGQTKALTEVRALARILRQYDLSELDVEADGLRISLKRQPTKGTEGATTSPPDNDTRMVAPRAVVSELADDGSNGRVSGKRNRGELVTSPLVGTFYRAPSPDSVPFVEVGDPVRKGQTLCIIEAMKLMNEIEAERDGKVLEILVADGQAVEYGQPLVRVEPS